MNVLSIFDGMSCGQIALGRAGIKVDNYFASEIDKYAIKVTQANYPNTVQMGCVTRHDDWHLPEIDLLIAGFPCQAWSVAGKQKGDNDPRGALVHDLISVWKKYKPKHFMFENVRMKKEFMEYINDLFGVEPILIDSALVSAQNRKRYYWTNIPGVNQPDDHGILLNDIIESVGFCVSYNRKKGVGRELIKSYSLCASDWRVLNRNQNQTAIIMTARGNNPGGIRAIDGKVPSLSKSSWEHNFHLTDGVKYRKLTPVECERLQTIDDNHTNHVSNSQRYKMIGNGWTVDVVAHIFKGLK